MEKARAAVSDFVHKAGHHDTTVHEKVAPAVTDETIVKTRHDEVQTALDKEIHQDHYHTTVQPVKDREVRPEQHSHNLAGVEHREHRHGNHDFIPDKLEQERAQFKSRQTEHTKHSESTLPTVAGEHVHHNVHETIQPVVQKETIQPSVVHTTVPIHEVHHNEPKHHAASALPAVSLNEFQRHGGTLGGREERIDGFEGEPKGVSSALGSSAANIGNSNSRGTTTSSNAGPHDSNLGNKLDPRVDSDRDGSRQVGDTGTNSGYGSNSGVNNGRNGGYGSSTSTTNNNDGSGYGSRNTGSTNSGPHNSSLANKADPRVDSNRDGQAGFGK
ncbi:MAG: hypothetical protein M1825_005643 [Sarcosagium campestre]|nr:MAG: hypothetical protein M1825_005643 [Sarcosagium campestre]